MIHLVARTSSWTPLRRLFIFVGLTTGLLIVGPPFAAATPVVRECGTYDYNTTPPRWVFRGGSGATNVANLTTRKVTCRTARRFALRYKGTDTYYPAWRCRETSEYEASEVRCTASRGRVVHWFGGS
jgi:hypothetical protein